MREDLQPPDLDDIPRARRWEAIASALRDDIGSGLFAPGTRLPNETQLAERFGVHRHTLRQAVQALVREGHLSVRHAATRAPVSRTASRRLTAAGPGAMASTPP